MKKRLFCYVSLMLILILDSKTAMEGVSDGIGLCTRSVIPSLFPFLVLSSLLTEALRHVCLPAPNVLCGIFRIPANALPVVLLGFLGGYPSGAQAAARSVADGSISRENSRNLLAFCSNAGPSFLFGMGSAIFPNRWMSWTLWGIHMVSALLVAQCFPCQPEDRCVSKTHSGGTISQAMERCTRVMAMICGWVLLFRVLLRFCDKWILWFFPDWLRILLFGILELSNGICELGRLESIRLRFVLFSAMLGFGGLCVTMQTYTVAKELDTSCYLPGKLLQGLISAMLAASVFSREMATLTIACILFLLLLRKKGIAFGNKLMYNRENPTGRKASCYFAKRSRRNALIVSTPPS